MAEAAANVVRIIKERTSTHGDYADNAAIAMHTRMLWRDTPNWPHLRPGQQLALEEIALKVARLLSTGSNADFKEHWDDIAGYALKTLE